MQIGETVRRLFRVADPANNGANVDADLLPTAILRKNLVTVGAASVSVVKIDTGYYSVSVLLDAAHGWVVSDTWSIDVSYSVSGDAITRPVGGGVIQDIGAEVEAGIVAVGIDTLVTNGIVAVGIDTLVTNGIVAVGIDTLVTNGIVAVGIDTLVTNGIVAVGIDTLVTNGIVAVGIDTLVTNGITAVDIPGLITSGMQGVNVIIAATAVLLQSIDVSGNITIQRGDTFTCQITGLGDLTTKDKIWFTIKENFADTDEKALVQITLDGLQIFNGADASTDAAKGSITIDDESNGDITLYLSEEYTKDLEACDTAIYDIQLLKDDGTITTLIMGKATVNKDVTQDIGAEIV